jgi:hypothetical protein
MIIRATRVTVPLQAPQRDANGCHWGRFVRTIVEAPSIRIEPKENASTRMGTSAACCISGKHATLVVAQ